MSQDASDVVAKVGQWELVTIDLDGEGPLEPVPLWLPQITVSVHAPVAQHSKRSDEREGLPGWVYALLTLLVGGAALYWYVHIRAPNEHEYDKLQERIA